jgi:formamidopyrimidine-DNA glycosylase
MPELPEVETTRQGLLPLVTGQRITKVRLRERRLRWAAPANLARLLEGRTIGGITRRAKYLLWDIESQRDGGLLLCHLGMSGTLFSVSARARPKPHDHLDIVLDNGLAIRYNDPRRFGAVLWIPGSTASHPLLNHLGPEPLTDAFSGEHLYRLSRGRRVDVKQFIMDAKVVVGVGNIYASESLFEAGIRPDRAAGRISARRYDALAAAIRNVLMRAIARGGSSLRDYVNAEGASGYFQLEAHVYGRAGEACHQCGQPVRHLWQGQRSTYYCAHCQT